MSPRNDKPHNDRSSTSASNKALATVSSPGLRPMTTRDSMKRKVDSQQGLSPQFLLHSLLHWWKVAAPIGLVLAVAGAAVVWWLFEPVYLSNAFIQIREIPPALVFEIEAQSKGYVETQKYEFILKMTYPTIAKIMAEKNFSQYTCWTSSSQLNNISHSPNYRVLGKNRISILNTTDNDGPNSGRNR